MRLRRHRRSASAVLAGTALSFLAGCSTSTPSDSTATTNAASSPATTATSRPGCADVADLKSSLEALAKVRPLQDGLTAVNAAIADVRTNLTTAVASAGADLQPAVEQVGTAFTAVQTAASGVTADNLRHKAPAINTAIQQLGTSTASLATTLTQRCPGS